METTSHAPEKMRKPFNKNNVKVIYCYGKNIKKLLITTTESCSITLRVNKINISAIVELKPPVHQKVIIWLKIQYIQRKRKLKIEIVLAIENEWRKRYYNLRLSCKHSKYENVTPLSAYYGKIRREAGRFNKIRRKAERVEILVIGVGYTQRKTLLYYVWAAIREC